jgi:VanZ family protein
MKKSLACLIIAVAYMVAIFIFSSLPQEFLTPEETFLRFSISSTIKHAAEYFILSLLLFLWLANTRVGRSSYSSAFILAVIISSVYGITDELHQAWVPTRYCTIPDMLSNFFGSVLIAPITYNLQKRKSKINKNSEKSKIP